MAFLTKIDYSGLTATGGALNGVVKCVSSNDGATFGGTAMCKDSEGKVKAIQPYRLNYGASNEFKLVKDIPANTTIKIGKGTHTEVGNFCLTGFTINTSNSATPTFSATISQAEDGNTASDAFGATEVTIPEKVDFRFKAQSLFGANVGGTPATHTGVYLQSANYNITCDSNQTTVTDAETPMNNGIMCNAVSVVRVEATFEFRGNANSSTGNALTVKENGATGTSDLTLGNGWMITAPVSCSNPEEDYPTFTFSATKYFDLVETPQSEG